MNKRNLIYLVLIGTIVFLVSKKTSVITSVYRRSDRKFLGELTGRNDAEPGSIVTESGTPPTYSYAKTDLDWAQIVQSQAYLKRQIIWKGKDLERGVKG